MSPAPPTTEPTEGATRVKGPRRPLTVARLGRGMMRVNVDVDAFRRDLRARVEAAGLALTVEREAAINSASRAELRAQVVGRQLKDATGEGLIDLLDRYASATQDRDKAIGRIGFPAGDANPLAGIFEPHPMAQAAPRREVMTWGDAPAATSGEAVSGAPVASEGGSR